MFKDCLIILSSEISSGFSSSVYKPKTDLASIFRTSLPFIDNIMSLTKSSGRALNDAICSENSASSFIFGKCPVNSRNTVSSKPCRSSFWNPLVMASISIPLYNNLPGIAITLPSSFLYPTTSPIFVSPTKTPVPSLFLRPRFTSNSSKSSVLI